ncbi:zinc finger protein hangover [Anastrepha ludens]|uniref:zinc finger protein hangover n=1 Tax=Anastrepha ludens TaxID=28586 RepID=UPI0023B01634|nr:zinc finger protein hangover [Anastrepha ludens]
MSDGSPVRARQNCCRLCLAPGSECISILNSYAADKEPLATKIQNCVSIKINPDDHLSLRICHACISYLNSWQSFKNRCIASQSKQRSWLDCNKRQQLLDNNVSISTIGADGTNQQQQQHSEDGEQQAPSLASSILDGISSLKKRKSLTVYPLPAVEIKDEPLDPDDDYSAKQHDESDDMVDPTLFLERTEEEGDEALMEHMSYQYETPRPPIELAVLADTKEASCRACNLKFSTRANARRHERNLHPNLFELSTSTPNNMPVTKPTPALAAALELQRASAAAVAAAEASKAASGIITPLKYRQEIVNAFNKCEIGGFDYEHPEKYQHHLTDEKIVFLQQNDEFLRQYQNMTCRCCNKTYSTYKNFMAHMRKKYLTLPRNLCFNCLKLNDSKALFISHLKRRNCINLYKVLHALMAKDSGFAAAVTATAAAVPEKLRAKELLVNKMYECKLCPKWYRLKLEFRSHVYDEHADMQRKDTMQKQCCYCGLELEDAAERKRHYNNMDCIVSLRCVTCDSKFDKHQKFLDHVYEKHLAGFGDQSSGTAHNISAMSTENSPGKKSTAGLGGASSTDESRSSHQATSSTQPKSQYFSRMPQACPICDQQYNNYNNVLRHMESKHPDQLPQTYKCVKCGIGYPRLSNLREHMVSAHAADKARHTGFEYIVNADAVKIAYGTTQNVYTGRYDYVMKDLMSITNGGSIADDDENSSEHAAKKMRIDGGGAVTTSTGSGSGNASGSGNMYSSLKECPICNAVFSNNIGLSNHMRSHSAAAQNSSMSAAAASTSKSSPSGLTITPQPPSKPTTPPAMQHQTAVQKAIFKRSLEQAADRRFRRMRCRLCQRRFSSKKSYRFHMLNDHQIRNVQFIKCKLCDAEFAYEKGLKVHMFKIHNTLLKDEMIVKQFECDICSIVYRSEDQLQQHKKTVHGGATAGAEQKAQQGGDEALDESNTAANPADRSGISTPVSSVGAGGGDRSTLDTSTSGPLYWYQCKYCPSNFNTNKKLAIHINSHDEFDSNDYSCKDCGNVYSGRKSLWVHRYKKHPQFAEPSECVLCKKVFFDSQMLENHIPTCNRKPITATGAVAESAGPPPIYKHKTGDDDDDEASHDASGVITTNALGGGELEITPIPATGLKIKLPEVACTICGQRFVDQDLFAKHIQMHELELYTDNPLAAMFDTGPADPNQFYLDRVNDNGEYACDLCNKTFTQMTALKVHRKWHFRGDSKQCQADVDHSTKAARLSSQSLIQTNHQHPLGLQAVGLMPNPQHHSSKSQKRKRELKCEYCPSTFISNNNLRRHIYELHKDEIGNLPVPPKINTDPYLHCRRCQQKFETKSDWIEHKVADARVTKPFGPFQWGCELCGAYVSRKEKLINHINNHLKEKEIVPVQDQQPAHDQNQNRAKSTVVAAAAASGKNVDDMMDEVVVKRERDDDKEESNDGIKEEEESEEEDGVVDDEADEEGEEEQKARERGETGRRGAELDDEVDEDGSEDELDEEYEDMGEMMQVAMTEHANHDEAEQDEDDGDADDGEEDADADADEADDVDDVDVHNDDSNDVTAPNGGGAYGRGPPVASQVTIEAIRNSTDTTGDSSPSYDEDDDDDNDSDADSDADSGDSSSQASKTPAPAPKVRFSCDLCRLFFDSQQELQKHVKMHFLNGPGSVSLTEIKPKAGNKSSRSSSSDVVAV